jgi:hypothetical protein
VGLIDRQKLGAEPQTDHRDIDGLRHGSRPPYDSEEKGERKMSVNKKILSLSKRPAQIKY